MNKFEPDWRWGTPEGNREFDRLMDFRLTLREKIQWIEDAESLHEFLATNRTNKGHEEASDLIAQKIAPYKK